MCVSVSVSVSVSTAIHNIKLTKNIVMSYFCAFPTVEGFIVHRSIEPEWVKLRVFCQYTPLLYWCFCLNLYG